MKHADFIVEAVVEDEKVKRSIFQELDKVRIGISISHPTRTHAAATAAAVGAHGSMQEVQTSCMHVRMLVLQRHLPGTHVVLIN